MLHGGWAEISPVWNWQYTWASRLFEAMADAHVVHFIGPKKPWRHDGGELPLRFRRAYRGVLRRAFSRGADRRGRGARRWRTAAFLQRSLAKHLLGRARCAPISGGSRAT